MSYIVHYRGIFRISSLCIHGLESEFVTRRPWWQSSATAFRAPAGTVHERVLLLQRPSSTWARRRPPGGARARRGCATSAAARARCAATAGRRWRCRCPRARRCATTAGSPSGATSSPWVKHSHQRLYIAFCDCTHHFVRAQFIYNLRASDSVLFGKRCLILLYY